MTDGKIESMGEPNRIDVFINYRSTFTNQQLISVGNMRTDRTMRMRVYARMSLCTCTWVNGVGEGNGKYVSVLGNARMRVDVCANQNDRSDSMRIKRKKINVYVYVA